MTHTYSSTIKLHNSSPIYYMTSLKVPQHIVLVQAAVSAPTSRDQEGRTAGAHGHRTSERPSQEARAHGQQHQGGRHKKQEHMESEHQEVQHDRQILKPVNNRKSSTFCKLLHFAFAPVSWLSVLSG